MKYDVIVIGGGAAGLSCAVLLAEQVKLNILIVEAGERAGKKLAATGNGQGNVTNKNMSVSHYFGGNLPLVERLCCHDGQEKLEPSLFHCVIGGDEVGRVYPGGRQASALVDSLLYDCKRYGITLKTSCRALKIEKVGGSFCVNLSDGQTAESNFVVFCVGGKAQKQFKTDGSSYALAEYFGHKVTPLYPSLVQLKTDTKFTKALKGIRTDCKVTALCGGKVLAEKSGDVIFTEYGLSGNAIFAISSYVVDKSGVMLELEFLPNVCKEKVENDIRRKKELGYPDSELLSGTLHNQLGRAIIKRAGNSDPEKIAELVKHFSLAVVGNLGFDYAQVTKGGISMKDVSDELESKLVKGLFFAGEVLDVDGECGGYNLHWAFSSAQKVADTIAMRVKNEKVR